MTMPDSPRRKTCLQFATFLASFALVLASSAISPAQSPQQSAPAQSPQQSASPAKPADLPPLPMSPIEKAQKDGTALPLSLKDVTKLALQNNLDIAISDTNEQIFQLKVAGTYGPYDPSITVGAGVGSTKQPNTNASNQAAGTFSTTDSANWNVGFSQNIPTGGGITAFYNTSRRDSNQIFDLFSPQYTARTQIQFTQPLRRNFHTDQYRTSIKLANLDVKTNDSQFKQKVTDTISSIQGQYWDLVSAIRDYDIQRESVKLAQISLRDNQRKVEVGTLAPITVIQSQADLANREVTLIQSEEKIYTVENALRSLISNDRNGDIWKKSIVPTDTPDYKEYPVNLDQSIDTALGNRPELEQLSIKLRQYELNYSLQKNAQRWQFDFVGQFGTNGTAGPQAYKNGVPQNAQELIGGVGNSYKVAFIGGYINWNVGFQIQIPLKNRSVESQLAQIKVQQRQVQMNLRQLEQQIQVDVRNAVQRLETTKKSVETSRVGRELAQAQLEGEQKRFEAGLSEAYRVLDQQRALSSAQGQELNAQINYKKAIINLQKAMYTLLESNDFDVAKGISKQIPELK
jgi:outer membrane protein